MPANLGSFDRVYMYEPWPLPVVARLFYIN